MIRFNHMGIEYVAQFSYRQKDSISPQHWPEDIDPSKVDPWDELDGWDRCYPCITLCLLTGGDIDGRDDGKSFVGLGVAYQHPNDQMVKKLGRRIALGRALKSLDSRIRGAAWGAYRARKTSNVQEPV